MNAKELFEIVKDVPKDAWPSCVTGWIRGIYVEVRTSETGDKPHAVSSHMFAEDAVLLFEASMMRELLRRQTKGHYICWQRRDGYERICRFKPISGEWEDLGMGATKVEALAAACKAVGK